MEELGSHTFQAHFHMLIGSTTLKLQNYTIPPENDQETIKYICHNCCFHKVSWEPVVKLSQIFMLFPHIYAKSGLQSMSTMFLQIYLQGIIG